MELMKYMVDDGFSFDIIGGSLNYLTGKSFGGFKGLWQKSGINLKNSTLLRVYVPQTYRKGFLGRILCYFTYLVLSVICGFKAKKPDIVLATSPSLFTALAGYIISRVKKVPFYLEIRDLWPKVAVEMGMLKNKKIINLSYKLEKFLCKKADKIIVITKGYADYIKELGIDPDKIRVIPNGIDAPMLEFESKVFPADIAEHKNKFIAMYAGAVSKFNFLDKLVVVAEKLRKEKDVIFMIIGDGNQKNALADMIKSKNLENILLLGSRTKNEISNYIANGDLCVNFYPFIDTSRLILQNKILDYMALGKPVLLQAPEGVTSEIIKKSGCGFVTGENLDDFAEKIKWFKENKEKIANMGILGREYVKNNFLRENLAKELSRILKT